MRVILLLLLSPYPTPFIGSTGQTLSFENIEGALAYFFSSKDSQWQNKLKWIIIEIAELKNDTDIYIQPPFKMKQLIVALLALVALAPLHAQDQNEKPPAFAPSYIIKVAPGRILVWKNWPGYRISLQKEEVDKLQYRNSS